MKLGFKISFKEKTFHWCTGLLKFIRIFAGKGSLLHSNNVPSSHFLIDIFPSLK